MSRPRPTTALGDLHWQAHSLAKTDRAALKGQRPACLWLTGLSGAGKSTLANQLEECLHAVGRHTYVLDGDNVRHGLNHDLGFTDPDRVENVRRVAEVAHLMVDAGLVVIVSLISPFRSDRARARALFEPGEFLEVFVDAPLQECMRRDPKGLYAKAQQGQLSHFTGLGGRYEAPLSPEVHVQTPCMSPMEGARRILQRLDALQGRGA